MVGLRIDCVLYPLDKFETKAAMKIISIPKVINIKNMYKTNSAFRSIEAAWDWEGRK